jgi:formylglycine-generating enzyme required for sulfatase activity
MVVGKAPYTADTPIAVALKHVHEPVPSVRDVRPELSEAVEAVVRKGLAKEPKNRYATAGELAREFTKAVGAAALDAPTQLMRLAGAAAEKRSQEDDTFDGPGPATTTGSKGARARLKGSGASQTEPSLRSRVRLRAVLITLGTVVLALAALIGTVTLGGAYILGSILDSAISNASIRFEEYGPGEQVTLSRADLETTLNRQVALTLPGSLSDITLDFVPPDELVASGKGFGRDISLLLKADIKAGMPVIRLVRFNGKLLPLVGDLVAGGLNRGMAKQLTGAKIEVTSIEIDEEHVSLILSGPGQPRPTPTPTPTLPPTSTPEPSATPLPPAGAMSFSTSDGMTSVYVPAGEFLMGAADDGDAAPDEKPQHSVFLDAFWIDRTEVTNTQYQRCVLTDGCSPPLRADSQEQPVYYGNPRFAAYPMIYVTWAQARVYCQWAGRRLPTEAEWEKGARGTDGRIYPWGNETPDASRLDLDSPLLDTQAVGLATAGASPYGALDMAGNVWEWVGDWYQADYYAVSPSGSPLGPEAGTERVLRGGAYTTRLAVRASDRYSFNPGTARNNIGFRCVADP